MSLQGKRVLQNHDFMWEVCHKKAMSLWRYMDVTSFINYRYILHAYTQSGLSGQFGFVTSRVFPNWPKVEIALKYNWPNVEIALKYDLHVTYHRVNL